MSASLRTFILAHSNALADEWMSLPGTGPAICSDSHSLELQDLLRLIVCSIASTMTLDERQPGGMRSTLVDLSNADRGSPSRYGALRHRQGFGSGQLVRDFGNLRTVVMTRWRGATPSGDAMVLEQSIRFNRAVDIVMQESIDGFVTAMNCARDAYLLTLGEDMRTPLSVIHVASTVLSRPDFAPGTRRHAARRARRALARVDSLLCSLMEYTRARSASGIPLERSTVDLGLLCEECIQTIAAAHADRIFEFCSSGDLSASVDGPRISQALANLLQNAIEHGGRQPPIRLTAVASSNGISLSVWNAGSAIPPASLQSIFEPRIGPGQSTPNNAQGGFGNLGLGLFIVREIAAGHGGDAIAASSDADGTRFTINLPLTTSASIKPRRAENLQVAQFR